MSATSARTDGSACPGSREPSTHIRRFSSTAASTSPASSAASSAAPYSRKWADQSRPGSAELSSASPRTRSGQLLATSSATRPPKDAPTSATLSSSSASSSPIRSRAGMDVPGGSAERPNPRMSKRTYSRVSGSSASNGSHILMSATPACTSTTAGPEPLRSNASSGSGSGSSRPALLRGPRPADIGPVTAGRSRGRSSSVSSALPLWSALLAECLDPLAEVLRVEARLAQLDKLGLDVGRQRARHLAQRAKDPLVPLERQRRVGRDLGREREYGLLELVGVHDLVHEPHGTGAVGVHVAAGEEQLVRVREAAHLHEATQPGVTVDEPDLGRRHAELHAVDGHADVAGHRQLEAAAERVAVDRGDDRVAVCGERVDRVRERVRDQLLRRLREGALVVEVADVVSGREHGPVARHDEAARILLLDGVRDGVEDLVVERAALVRVRDREPDDTLAGPVDAELPGSQLLCRANRGQPACRLQTLPGPLRIRWRT